MLPERLARRGINHAGHRQAGLRLKRTQRRGSTRPVEAVNRRDRSPSLANDAVCIAARGKGRRNLWRCCEMRHLPLRGW